MLTFQQVTNIRELLLCSTLSERPIKIMLNPHPPQLQTLLKLFQLVQTKCGIDVTTNSLTYIPGIITNVASLPQHFKCGQDRSISYFLEPLMILSLYGKAGLDIELEGKTADGIDMSVDTLIQAYLGLIKQFAPDWEAQIKIVRRDSQNGLVHFTSKPIKQLKNVTLIERGPIKRIRGICWGVKVAPNLLNRIVSKCREVFNDYIPDVWITTDLQKSVKNIELCNGYGVSLVAESINGAMISCDSELNQECKNPEEVGEKAALSLLDEIENAGFVDSSLQQYALLMMALSQKKLSQLQVGRITTQTVESLRIIKQLFGVTFNIEGQVFSCIGCGLMNISRITQ